MYIGDFPSASLPGVVAEVKENKEIFIKFTECPKSYRKSVLHLLKYRFEVYLVDAAQICGNFWGIEYQEK